MTTTTDQSVTHKIKVIKRLLSDANPYYSSNAGLHDCLEFAFDLKKYLSDQHELAISWIRGGHRNHTGNDCELELTLNEDPNQKDWPDVLAFIDSQSKRLNLIILINDQRGS